MNDKNLRAELYHRYITSLRVLVASLVTILALLILILPLSAQQKYWLEGLLGIAAGYLLLVFWVIPYHWLFNVWAGILNCFLLVTLISGAYGFLYKFSSSPIATYLFVIFFSGLFLGKSVAYTTAVVSLLGVIAVDNYYAQATVYQATTQGVFSILFLITAHVSNALGDTLTAHMAEQKRKNKELSLLLDASITATASLDLTETMPALARKLVHFLPVSLARIDLFEENGLICYGIADHRLSNLKASQQISLPEWENLPWLQAAFQTQRSVIFHRSQFESSPNWQDFTHFFSAHTQGACVVPLLASNRVLGFISIGEERQPGREPIDQVKVEFLETLANQVAMVVENARLHLQEQKKSKRLEVLNRIAAVIGSTIEMEVLLQELYQLLIQVIPADTYYVGIVDWQNKLIQLKLLFDAGELFEGVTLPLDQGLASYVVTQRKPLLIRNLLAEMESLPVKPLIVGKEQISASWLGVPFGKQDHTQGILAVASYTANAFDEEDLQLLTNVAQQTALAFDNARHHADVEEQARRDSLTGAYNHGYFLATLRQAIHASLANRQPMSLIMLDIDYFKEYNDRYGHTVGDEVLRLIVQVIRNQVKSRDVIGRWGGEEFGLILEGATLENAVQVAQRIRSALMQAHLTSSQGRAIPSPTISQGIATLPDHAKSAEELVEKADQALYLAKNAGRDQIYLYRSALSIK
ncbi:MAG: hypothetical protein Kow0088_20330 [Anaerolineales bacterium]